MNIQPELKKRIMTGALGGSVLLGLITLGGWLGVFFIATVVSLGMLFEFCTITYSLPDRVEKRYVMLSVAWFVAVVNLLAPQAEFQLLTLTFLSVFIYFLFSAKRFQDHQFTTHFKELMISLFGFVYLVLMPLYLLRIFELPHGIHWVLVFLFIVWTGDSAAYFVGKKYGRRKLYPQISPKKTVEGSMGGLAAGVVVTLLYKGIFFRNLPWLGVLILPVIVGAFAQIGDLCESFFKRAFDKKDSGSILPGHGGFLDRFDGVVFSLPVMYACVRIFG